MANLYGVANPVSMPVTVNQPSLVSCNPGVETTVMSATLAAISTGFYYPLVFGALYIQCGATPPGSAVIAARIGAGSDFQAIGIAPAFLVANAQLMWWFMLVGTASQTVWQGAGATVNVTLTGTTQLINASNAGAWAQFFLYRAPDQ